MPPQLVATFNRGIAGWWDHDAGPKPDDRLDRIRAALTDFDKKKIVVGAFLEELRTVLMEPRK